MKARMKTYAIRAALAAIALLQLGKLFPALGGRGVIFTLHHVRPKSPRSFDPNAHLEITPEFLEIAILASKNAGLVPARLQDLPRLLASTDKTTRYVCFTLDDGYKDNASFAAPIFAKFNMPYTIFVCPGFVLRTRTIWWKTIAAMLDKTSKVSFDFGSGLETLETSSRRAKLSAFNRFGRFVAEADEDSAVSQIDRLAQSLGVNAHSIVEDETMNAGELAALSRDNLCSFGGHTLTHCNLKRVSPERLHHEIKQSSDLVSSYVGAPVTTFAYPYGGAHAAGAREFTAAKTRGLSVAVTTVPGTLTPSALQTMTGLKRVSLNGHYQKYRYVSALISGLPFQFLTR